MGHMMTSSTQQPDLGEAPAGTQGSGVRGRVALVTGGTGGIGAAVCRALADQGASVAAGYWHHPERSEKFLASMSTEYPGQKITVHEGNIGVAGDCRNVVREVISRETLSRRPHQIRAVLPERRWPFVEEVTAEWLDWLEGAGVDIVGDPADLRPQRPDFTDGTWVHPDKPPADQVAEAALEALAAVIEDIAPTHKSPVRRLARRLLRG